MNNVFPVSFEKVDITGGFWAERQKINRETTIFSVMERFDETGRFEAFNFNYTEGSDLPKPHFFWDSDVAKWIESCAYIIEKTPDERLEKRCDEVIDKIAANMDENGYFNIYHTVIEPENRFKIRDHHELYCLGHLIEAGIAYYKATGKAKLLDVLDKYVDLVIKAFVTEKTAAFTVPGHEEIELALIKLYRLKKDKKYIDLAMFFLNERGCGTQSIGEWCNTKLDQSHLPIRQQRTAEGHCVRACYLYSAMADAAKETGDTEILESCKSIFDDIVTKKMYISGGIGSSHCGESFTIPYDLPNETAYSETCAAISLAMFANRMKEIDFNSKYADTVETELYNGFLSGVSLDGTAFFYENPLSITLEKRSRHTCVFQNEMRLPITQRQKVFNCSCCPPNVTRFIAALGDYAFSYNENSIFIHQFMSCDAEIDGAGVTVETDYPSNGKINIGIAGAKGKQLFVRVPGWCKKYNFSENYTLQNGYAVFDITGDIFNLYADFIMTPVFVAASPYVTEDVSRAAVMYGPVLYCAEQNDNELNVHALSALTDSSFYVCYDSYFGCNVLTLQCSVPVASDFTGLYKPLNEIEYKLSTLKLIPYFGFANRGDSDMTVWLHVR